MDGKSTIIVILKWYLQPVDVEISKFDTICDILLTDLFRSAGDQEQVLEDLEFEIQRLAHLFWSNLHSDLTVIEKDLWTLLENWLDTVIWVQDTLSTSMETEDLFADLLCDIVKQIKDRKNKNTAKIRQYYNSNVIKALIQLSMPPYSITDPYLTQTSANLPSHKVLKILLEKYRNLSRHNHFGNNNVHILLQLLSGKLDRNSNRHAGDKVQEYVNYCEKQSMFPSFRDYISYRGLDIPPEFLHDCERLFLEKYGNIL